MSTDLRTSSKVSDLVLGKIAHIHHKLTHEMRNGELNATIRLRLEVYMVASLNQAGQTRKYALPRHMRSLVMGNKWLASAVRTIAPPKSRRRKLLKTTLGFVTQTTEAPPVVKISQPQSVPLTEQILENILLHQSTIDWTQLKQDVPKREPNLISLLIPVFNKVELTEVCLRSVSRLTEGEQIEFVIVDNASTDGTPTIVEQLRSEIKRCKIVYVRNERNYGYAYASDLALAKSSGQMVVFFNNDTEACSPDWLSQLIEPLRRDSSIGAVGPKLMFPDLTLQSGGLVFNPRSCIANNIYQFRPADQPEVNKPRFFQAVTGACLAMRAEDAIQLQGFNPLYLNGMEDVELCLRITKELGLRIYYNPASAILHHEGQTSGRSVAIMENRKRFVARWQNKIEADDKSYYAQDGLQVVDYVKKNRGDDATSLFVPNLRESE